MRGRLPHLLPVLTLLGPVVCVRAWQLVPPTYQFSTPSELALRTEVRVTALEKDLDDISGLLRANRETLATVAGRVDLLLGAVGGILIFLGGSYFWDRARETRISARLGVLEARGARDALQCEETSCQAVALEERLRAVERACDRRHPDHS